MGFQRGSVKSLQKRDPKVFGTPKGVKIFSRYPDRVSLYVEGVHGVTEAGIHGAAGVGAYSVVVAGRYDDDEDFGDTILYTGAGGHSRDSSLQTKDQDWSRGNAALRMSCKAKRPVRVIRSHLLRSKYAPGSGYRYDGLYNVVEAEQTIGVQGHAICRFTLERVPGQPPLPGQPGHFVPAGADGEEEEVDGNLSAPIASSSRRTPAGASSSSARTDRKPVSRRKREKSPEIRVKFEGSYSPVKPEPQDTSLPSRSAAAVYARHPLPGLI